MKSGKATLTKSLYWKKIPFLQLNFFHWLSAYFAGSSLLIQLRLDEQLSQAAHVIRTVLLKFYWLLTWILTKNCE